MGVKTKYYMAFAYRYRFLILWIAFLLEFIVPSFENNINYHFAESIIFTFLIFAGFNVLLARKRMLYLIVFLGITIVLARFINDDVLPLWTEYIKDAVLISYYSVIIYEIFKELVDQQKVNLNTIGAVLAGFFVIGVIGGVIFSSIETTSPGSFVGLNEGREKVHDLVYFSFITLTTIGYGDISPVSYFAQRVTVIFGLIGNFYSTIIIGIIISKFLSSKSK